MKQTAVEWLMENLHTAKDPFKQAEEMEKKQLFYAWDKGYGEGLVDMNTLKK